MRRTENIEDHIAYACRCGGVKFNLLKSGNTECCKCGENTTNWKQNMSYTTKLNSNPKSIMVRLDGKRSLHQRSSNPIQAEDVTLEEFYQYIKLRLHKESTIRPIKSLT